MNQQTVLITGGTGLVGTHLANHLVNAGYKVIILTRNPAKAKQWHKDVTFARWDVNKHEIDIAALQQADAIINLAGAGVVAKPWTAAYKKEIIDSRVRSGETLVKALSENDNKVSAVVSASAIGWYGPDKSESAFTESAPADNAFLGTTCKQWEDSVMPLQTLGKRLVILRIGIVLANEGGALPEFKMPLRFRVAGVLGNGRQIVSWIHIDDLCRMFQYAIEEKSMAGVYNSVAPNPVTNKELTITLARQMHGKAFVPMPVPAFVLKIMLGDRSVEVLKSTTVSSKKVTDGGFQFNFPTIADALANLVKES